MTTAIIHCTINQDVDKLGDGSEIYLDGMVRFLSPHRQEPPPCLQCALVCMLSATPIVRLNDLVSVVSEGQHHG